MTKENAKEKRWFVFIPKETCTLPTYVDEATIASYLVSYFWSLSFQLPGDSSVFITGNSKIF